MEISSSDFRFQLHAFFRILRRCSMSHAQCLFPLSTHFFSVTCTRTCKNIRTFSRNTHTHTHAIILAQEEIEPEDMSLADATHISEMTQRSINEKGVKEVWACTHRAHTPAHKSTHAYTSAVIILSFNLRYAKLHIYVCICMHFSLFENTFF